MKIYSNVAILPWGNVIEDFLEAINISLDAFCNEMTGGWLFGYIEALKTAGIETVLICISAAVTEPIRCIHKPTGAVIWLLPVPRIYRQIQQQMAEPYGWTVKDTFGSKAGWQYPWWFGVREMAAYLSTPLGAIAKIVREEGCQAMLCQEYEYARFDLCALLGKILKIPVFASFQGGNFRLTQFEALWRYWSIHSSSGLIVATQSEIDRLQKQYGLSSSKIVQLFNPLDLTVWEGGDRATTRLELGLAETATVVVWHGRIDLYRKGLDVLAEAWRQICDNHPDEDWHLLLIGTGADAPALHQRIEELQLPRVHRVNEYLLDRQRIRNYLKAADLYTLPSRHEGFPVAPLEAMACGLPIVATEVPGIPDILEHHEASGGIRVPCAAPERLAEAIARLLQDVTLRQLLGDRARQRVEDQFSLSSVGHGLKAFMFAGQDGSDTSR